MCNLSRIESNLVPMKLLLDFGYYLGMNSYRFSICQQKHIQLNMNRLQKLLTILFFLIRMANFEILTIRRDKVHKNNVLISYFLYSRTFSHALMCTVLFYKFQTNAKKCAELLLQLRKCHCVKDLCLVNTKAITNLFFTEQF